MVALEKKLTKYINDKNDGLETELQAKIEDIRTQNGEDLNNKFKIIVVPLIVLCVLSGLALVGCIHGLYSYEVDLVSVRFSHSVDA